MENHQKNLPRLLSLDVLRGITIAIMILVNSPGTTPVYAFLEHAKWNGCKLADLVFPCFIVIVGISAVLGLTSLKIKGYANKDLLVVIIKRTVYLFCLGLLLNLCMKNFDLSQVRLLGILQRIAICYFFSSTIFLFFTARTHLFIIFFILVTYYLLMALFPQVNTLNITNNVASFFDRFIISSQHLYRPLPDPKGILSMFPTICSALLGNLIGFCLISSRSKEKQFQWISVYGLILVSLGWTWSYLFPFNKTLWSSSFALWTAGISALAFASCFAIIEIKKYISWSEPFYLFGKNALFAFIMHIIFFKIQILIKIDITDGNVINLKQYITNSLFGGCLSPSNASLAYAITYALFWLLVIQLLTMWRTKFQKLPLTS